MSQQRKHFITRNEGFICLQCGFENPPLSGSCRNHCVKCLYSCHVDDQVPGDRLSECKGLMKPIRLDVPKKQQQMILHRCEKCGKEMRNRVQRDDEFQALLDIGKGM